MQLKKYFDVFLFTVCLIFIAACGGRRENSKADVPSTQPMALEHTEVAPPLKDSVPQSVESIPSREATSSVTEITIFKNALPLTGYGYDVSVNGSATIHQPNIPAVPGNRGFSSEEAARKTAQFVAFKLKNNIMPPSIDVKELDSLGVLK